MSDLFKRKGSDAWYCWVPVPGGGKERRSTGFDDKVVAQCRAVEMQREALDPTYAASNKATTPDACARFMTSRVARGRADGTLHHYRVKLGHIVRLMPQRLAEIGAGECEEFIASRRAEGAAQTTIKKELRALGAMLRHAKRLGLYPRDIDEVIPELDETYKPRERFLAPLELVALVNALPRHRAAHVVFVVATGARWGESVRARREDIDGYMVKLRGTKTKLAAGTVPVPPTMRIALAWALANASDLSDTPRLRGPSGEPTPLFDAWASVRRDLGAACARIGIDPVTPNDLRRTFATWLRMSGVTTDLIGAAMRHTTSRMAELVYGRIKPADLDKLISERGPALPMSPPEKESSGTVLLMGSKPSQNGPNQYQPVIPPTRAKPAKQPGNPVPGRGIEPRTRGFSILREARQTSADRVIPRPTVLLMGWRSEPEPAGGLPGRPHDR